MDTPRFLEQVAKYQHDGYRLMVVNASSVLPTGPEDKGTVELTWSFEKEGRLEHLKERVFPSEQVPSVSASYPFAYLYENEIAELFGVNVVGRNVDFQGKLYQTSTKVPMSPKAIRARLDAAKDAAKGKKS